MKLSSVNTAGIPGNSKINNNKRNAQNDTQVNFKGGAVNGLINFWQFIDNGGRALQFTAEDMTGTNLPRSGKGLFNGRKRTGKFNWKSFWQEFTREFLTGPTMCAVPVLVLNTAIKLAGKTADTHIENIKNLSYLLEKAGKIDSLREEAVKDMLKQSIGNEAKQKDIDSIKEGIDNYAKAAKKKDKKNILSDLQKTFESIIKKNIDNYKNVNFLSAKYSIDKDTIGATNFKNYIEYIEAYIQDYTKQFGSNVTADNIKSFKNSWIGKRLFTIGGMIFITGMLMFQIPKIYTKVSGKVNPNASVIYDEAKKRNKGGK